MCIRDSLKYKLLGQENTLALIYPSSASEGIESIKASRKEKSFPLSKLEELNQVNKILVYVTCK